MNILLYAKIVRAHALPLSILPVLSCFFYAKYNYGTVNTKAILFIGLAAVLFHLATNSISEYRDFCKNIDDPSSEFPRYKLIKCGCLDIKPRNILLIGWGAFFLASIFGIIAVFCSSIVILFSGLLGAALSLFYSEWPIGYKYRAFGELAVFAAFGPVLVFSCIFALTHRFGVNDLIFSLPIGLLATSVLVANNIRDYSYDCGRIKTLATILGLKLTYALLFFVVNLAFLLVPILIYTKSLPKSCLSVLLAYPLLFLSINRVGTPKFIDIFGMLYVAYCAFLCSVLFIALIN